MRQTSSLREQIANFFRRFHRRQIIFSIAVPLLLATALLAAALGRPESGSGEAEPPAAESEVSLPPITVEPVPVPEPEPVPVPVMDEESLLAIVDAFAEDYSAVGISAAVVENGEVSASCGWGMADLSGRAMTRDTKIRTASISKIPVALCAMKMAEDGLVDLESSISPYWGVDISSRAYPDEPISLERLMTHTSTISELDNQRSLSAAAAALAQHPFTGARPGSVWRYSNYGYGVIALTLEQACGTALEDYAQASFLQPMGMDASFYTASFAAEELASLYRGTTNEWSAANQAAVRLPSGIGDAMSFYCGNFTASAGDYAKLIALLANDGTYGGVAYLSPESVADMETPRLAASNEESEFTQCLTLRQKENIYGQEVLYYHTGSAYGVYSLASYNPETRNGVVVITSGADRRTDENGIYGLCAAISQSVYEKIDTAKGEAS